MRLRLALTVLLLPAVLLGAGMALLPGVSAQDIDLEEVFRCAGEEVGQDQCVEARNLIVNNCTSCHTFVPIVLQSFDESGWNALLDRHIGNGRVDQLSEEQLGLIHAYLSENFNGELPPPQLPQALLDTWTSY